MGADRQEKVSDSLYVCAICRGRLRKRRRWDSYELKHRFRKDTETDVNSIAQNAYPTTFALVHP